MNNRGTVEMRYRGYNAKRDDAEPDVVEALEKAGWEIHREMPVDLLCLKRVAGALVIKLVEVKTPKGKKNPKARIDKRQVEQNEFLERHQIPRTCTAVDALKAVGEIAS